MQNLTNKTRTGISAVLSGERRGWRSKLLFAGPAIIASVAYMDPGNYATNIQAGAGYGYTLMWVVLLANLIAMLFQALSARLGIVTGKNLAELSRDNFPKPVVWIMWAISEVAAMATDLAEFLGGAIGLALLFNLPLMVGMVITAIVTYAILIFERHGFRPMEMIIGAMVGQMIMQGFLHVRVPIWLRRLVTIVPAFAVVGMGVNATEALVMSQVVLSIALPVPMIALIIFSSRRDIMGAFIAGPLIRVLAALGACAVQGLNFVLLAEAFGLPILAG